MTPDPREHRPFRQPPRPQQRDIPLNPDPLTYVEPDPEPSSSPGTAVWIVAAGLVGLALVVGIAGYLASRS